MHVRLIWQVKVPSGWSVQTWHTLTNLDALALHRSGQAVAVCQLTAFAHGSDGSVERANSNHWIDEHGCASAGSLFESDGERCKAVNQVADVFALDGEPYIQR